MKRSTRGGAREGAGRKSQGGTTVVRVPNPVLSRVQKLIDDFKAKQKPADRRRADGDISDRAPSA